MKKYLLVMMMFIAMLGMTACSEENEPAVEREPEVEVKEPVVVEKPAEVTEPEEPTETEATDEGTAAVALNYENTKEGVEKEVFKILSNLNAVLTMGDQNPWTLEEIQTWFTDFDHSNEQAGVYIDKLTEKGVTLSEENDGARKYKKTEQGEGNVWNLEVEVNDTYKGKSATTMWFIEAQPNAEGNLAIKIKEIK